MSPPKTGAAVHFILNEAVVQKEKSGLNTTFNPDL